MILPANLSLFDENITRITYRVDQIPEFTRNAFDLCHGGALTTYVDIATTTSIFAFDEKERTHVSAKLDMDFMNAGKTEVKGGPKSPSILIETQINKIGKNMAFSEARIYEEESGLLICTGTHLKVFVNKKYDF